MRTRRRRERSAPADDWDELLPLFEWPEQENYEVIRPLVLFGESVTVKTMAHFSKAGSYNLYFVDS